jgi:cobalamin biosynthesis Mg chelatase CobN
LTVPGGLGLTGGTALNTGFFGTASSEELPAPAEAGAPAELAETSTPAAAPSAGKASSGTGDADKKDADKAAAPQAAGTQASDGTGFPFWPILLGLGVLALAVAGSILALRRRRIPA